MGKEQWRDGRKDALPGPGPNQRFLVINADSMNPFNLCPRPQCAAESTVTKVSAGRDDFFYFFFKRVGTDATM